MTLLCLLIYIPLEDMEMAQTLDVGVMRTASLSLLFDWIANIFAVIMLVELGNGFLYAASKKKAPFRTALLFAVVGVVVVLVVLAFSAFGIYNAAASDYWKTSPDPRHDDTDAYRILKSRQYIYAQLTIAFYIITFVISIAIVVYAAFVAHVYRAHPTAKSVRDTSSLLFSFAPDIYIRI